MWREDGRDINYSASPGTRPDHGGAVARRPERPQDRVSPRTKTGWASDLTGRFARQPPAASRLQRRGDSPRADGVEITLDGATFDLDNGDVVIAAITSCTNTSNPDVMVGAGLVARKALERGLTRKPWVKTSLAPGPRWSPSIWKRPGCWTTSRPPGSTWSATGAPPASATPARFPSRSPKPIAKVTSWSPRCFRATGTSKVASIPRSGPTTSAHPLWWSPTPWRARWTST